MSAGTVDPLVHLTPQNEPFVSPIFSSCAAKREDFIVVEFCRFHFAWPRTLHLLVLSILLVFFYLLAGLAMEFLNSQYADFEYAFFVTLVQFACFACFSSVPFFRELFATARIAATQSVDDDSDLERTHQISTVALLKRSFGLIRPHLPHYLLLGGLSVAGMGLGNESLMYMNYPTKMLFKSSKLLVIMAIGLVFLKRTYLWFEYASSFCLVVGLFLLFAASRIVDLMFDSRGYILLGLAVLADGVLANVQEKLLKDFETPISRLVFLSNFVGSWILVLVCALTNQLTHAFSFCWHNPRSVVFMLGYALSTYLGVLALHRITKTAGILWTHTVTSIRKIVSIALSFVLFPKPFHPFHAIGAVCIIGGVGLRSMGRRIGNWRRAKSQHERVSVEEDDDDDDERTKEEV